MLINTITAAKFENIVSILEVADKDPPFDELVSEWKNNLDKVEC